MKSWMKSLVCIVLSFSFLTICLGYAALTDTLRISGNAHVDAVKFEEIVITDIEAVSGTSISSQTAAIIPPTNIDCKLTGATGQKVVYKITAHNYSDTITYVYSGITWSPEFETAAGKLNISVSADASNTQLLPKSKGNSWVQGTPVRPGEDFVFYATYTLTENMTGEDIWIHYNFDKVIYSVTYLNNNETYAVDCITDNSVAYSVRKDKPQNGSLAFAGWVNANLVNVSSYPAGNTHDYTLSAKWDNIYLIIFADADGSVVYQETFTSSSTRLSAEGQAIVDAKLAELNAAAAAKQMTVSWSEYNIASATSDITVRAIYNYSGYLNLVPVYEQPDDGVVDYYKVMAVDSLPELVRVPGDVGGVPVKYIERITNVDGESDWDNFENTVKKIIIEEGVEEIGWNGLAWTPYLSEVVLPNSLNEMGKNVFSRNILGGTDQKKLTVTFNGTKAEWKAIVANSHEDWDGGLRDGTVIKCIDGYFELDKGLFTKKWNEKSY